MRNLDCIAPVSSADVESFQQNYATTYASRAADYVGAANRCDVGNGKASRGERTLFTGPLSNVARFRLGFGLPLGHDLVGTGMALHGYAGLDPALAGADRMIEFVTIWEGIGEPR